VKVRSSTRIGLGTSLVLDILVNDFPDWVVNNMLMFAKDTRLLCKILSHEDGTSFQDDLNCLADRSEIWSLKFNPEKCRVMYIKHSLK